MAMIRRTLFTLAATTIALAGSAAFAADLVTPEAFVGSQHSAACHSLNVTSKPLPGQVLLMKGSTVLADSGAVTVPAGGTASADANVPNGFIYCRCVKASKSKFRCSLGVFGTNADDTDEVVVPGN
jgi:hypothetical protein